MAALACSASAAPESAGPTGETVAGCVRAIERRVYMRSPVEGTAPLARLGRRHHIAGMSDPFEFPTPSFTLDSDSAAQGPGAAPAANDAAILDDYSRVVTGVVDRVGQSVVRIDVRKQGRSAGSGSGVIIASDGLALTNSHVVQGARTVGLTTLEGRELQARVLGDDPDTDLALLESRLTSRCRRRSSATARSSSAARSPSPSAIRSASTRP